jgi:GT2 family glycosyltransferase
MTCFNQKEKTLKSLECLFDQDVDIDVYIVNDGCTDGTHEAVVQKFPQVNIIRGNGNLYWNRGMRLAWETASNAKDYDFYLWLNSDTYLYQNDLTELFSVYHAVGGADVLVCASLQSPGSKEASYGGLGKNGLLAPDGTYRECLTMNGNCVLIPQSVFKKIGNLDRVFHHAIGDFDYGFRARKAGAKIYLTPCFVGACEKNPTLPKWCLKETPLPERIRVLYSPLGYAVPHHYFIYEKRHWGLFVAVKHFVSIHLRLIFPGLWK